ncbi:MAG: hypothetical protein BWY70_00772 [Bacteroidetes bacterium ADurb.Bin408]|nr:MAG: hypothetical protein BWY70_00772 [Bacteroidetes bacterium ADurb.Bin408]
MNNCCKYFFYTACFIICFFLPGVSAGQGRVEVEVSGLSDDYYLAPIGRNGVLLFGETGKNIRNVTPYTFTKYNVNFAKEWEVSVDVKYRLFPLKYVYDEQYEKLYVLMARGSTSYVADKYQVLELDIATKKISLLNGTFKRRTHIADFVVASGRVYFGGYTLPPNSDLFFKTMYSLMLFYVPAFFGSLNLKLKPFLCAADFTKGTLTEYPLNMKGNARVLSITTDKVTDDVNVLFSEKISRKDITQGIIVLDSLGTCTEKIVFADSGNIDILTGLLTRVDSNNRIVIGAFVPRPQGYKESYFNESIHNPASSGFYCAGLDENKQTFLKLYPYTKFTNFYNFLSDRSQMRIKKKMARRQARGKEYQAKYYVLVNDLIVQEKSLIFLAEAYYPEYETRCETAFNPNGTTYQRCYTVFTGYRVTHAIAAAFDNSGELLWDNSFEVMDVVSYELKPRVKALADGNELLLVYANNGELKSKVIAGGKVVESKNTVKIEAAHSSDKVKENYGSGISYWYNNYFIAYGYQKIKNLSAGNNTKKRVFYFNKIAYK